MRNLRIEVAYDGSRFYGWQRQEAFRSVQEALEDAVESLTGERVTVHGSGRTDTGVHALRQVANFHSETALADERLVFALNAHLEEGVVVRELETCPEGFQAQRAARGKRYAYVVRTCRFRPPFGSEHSHWVPDTLDLEAMRLAAGHLVGEHDFSALANAGSPRLSNVRRVKSLHVVARRETLAFVVEGTGFLYNMVRTLAGTLLEIGRHKLVPGDMPRILASKRRSEAGPTAPAAGLYLVRVLYDEPCFAGRDGRRAPPGCFPR